MLDRIQQQLNRINAAAVRLQSEDNTTALQSLHDDLESVADDAENPEPAAEVPASE